ncbi:MAG: sulfur carrier protein ThiS [Cyanobacteria bacterium]|jgi:sulfur carrier protein|nr:sulfur carrier protein ThiS [Cyanobacteriota bacterium]
MVNLSFNITVNGQDHQCESPTLLLDLLTQLKMNPKLVAIEYNGEILHRQFWPQTQIQAGDALEVVTIVGGG